jgi:5'-nucleotidase
MRKLTVVVWVALGLLLAVPIAVAKIDSKGSKAATVQVQLLAINDFHGNLEPPGGTLFGAAVGGAEYVSTHLTQLRSQNPNTLTVAAGDLIGASPLVSALFHDEPAIEALNAAGLQISSVGNHEFDEGRAELLRMQRGRCHPKDGCQDGDGFEGAKFKYLSANVEVQVTAAQRAAYAKARAKYARQLRARRAACAKNRRSAACKRKLKAPKAPKAAPLFPPYEIRTIGGVKIAFIGMTLQATPTIVTPSGVAGLRFLDEADTANRYVPELKRQKVETIVVLIHEGGVQPGQLNECPGISGPILDIVQRMNEEIDVILSGHTHQAYVCTVAGKLVTSASAFGRVVTDIDLEIDSNTGEITAKKATNTLVPRTIAKDPAQTQLLQKYQRISAPLANRVIGSITGDLTRAQTMAGESSLGDVIADAQLAATRAENKGRAQMAFMNPGGIRADFLASQISGGESAGQITYGEAFIVQPFGNSLVTMTLTGQQIDTLLEQQWSGGNAASPRILQVSNGLTYTWDASKPNTDRVNLADIKLNGTPLGATTTYRVTVNSFMADGGDNFAVLREGRDRLGGDVDLDALDAYFRASSPVQPGPRNRITRVN